MVKILMYKILIAFLFTSFLSANDEMMAMFESIKKQERNLILQYFKQEKELRFKIKNKPHFYRNSHSQRKSEHNSYYHTQGNQENGQVSFHKEHGERR